MSKGLFLWVASIFVLAVIVGSLWSQPILLTLVLAVLVLGYFLKAHTEDDLLYFFIPFFLGPVSEIIAIKFGAWNYTQPQLLGIPFWLPPLWGASGLILKNILKFL